MSDNNREQGTSHKKDTTAIQGTS